MAANTGDNKKFAVPSGSGIQREGKKLTGKIIFLDIRDAAVAKRLELKVRKLKAMVETFLTKDVNYVISSSDSLHRNVQGHRASPAFSNTPSPFHVTPSATPSPTYVNAQGKLVPFSRGQKMAQMARARARSPSPSSVVANAGRLGIKVIPVEAAERWLNKELKRQGLTIPEETSPPQLSEVRRQDALSNKTRQLLEPYIKVESTSQQYRPLLKEMAVWPHINLSTHYGTCPFDGIGVSLAPRSKGIGKEAAASRGNVVSPSTQSNPQRRSLEGDESSRLVGVPILTAGDLRRQQEKRKQEQRRRGYCECCHVKYDDIEQHLKEPSHVEFARDKNNYEGLDELMDQLPSASEFLHNTLLRHCAETLGEKPSTSASDLKADVASLAEKVSSISDHVLTVSYSSPTQAQRSDVPAVPESVLRERGLQTPTYSPQYPTGLASAADSPVSSRQQPAAAGDQAAPGPSADPDGDGGTKDSARSSEALSAVVIRRPGARSAYGSPRDKWSHSLSPYRRASPQSPKVRERSMVFGNSSIGSLKSVPEDQGQSTGSPEGSESRNRGDPDEAPGSQDRNKAREFALKRHAEHSTPPSTSRTSVKKLASSPSLTHGVYEEEEVHSVPGKSSQKMPRQKRKRDSSTLTSDVAAEKKMSSAAATQHKQGKSIVKEGQVEKSRHVDTEVQPEKKIRTLPKSSRASGSKRSFSSEETVFEKKSGEHENVDLKQTEGKRAEIRLTRVSELTSPAKRKKHRDAGTFCKPQASPQVLPRTSSRFSVSPDQMNIQKHKPQETHKWEHDGKSEAGGQNQPTESGHAVVLPPSLPRSPRKSGQHTPRKREPPRSDTEEVRTPQRRIQEEEMGSSPVYLPEAISTSTPTLVIVRKLRSTRGGVLFPPEKEGPSTSRSVLTDDGQFSPLGTSSTDREVSASASAEKSESRARRSLILRGAESSASGSKEGPASESKEGPASESKEGPASESKEGSLRRKGRFASRSEESLIAASEERSALTASKRAAPRSRERAYGGEESSASRSDDGGNKDRSKEKKRSPSRGEDSENEDRSRRTRKSTARSKERSASQASTDIEKRTTRRSSQNQKMSQLHSTSKETTREDGVCDSYCRSSDSCFTDVSRQFAMTSISTCSGHMEERGDVTPRKDSTSSLRIKLVRSPHSSVASSSTKKVKLSHSWQLLSDHSVSRLLKSETEASSFDGFHGDEALPSDLTYVSASEVEVTDDEDREWLIDQEVVSDSSEEEQGGQSLNEFIPTLSSPGKSNSSWGDACDLYVSQSVEQQLKIRQKRPRSPRKSSVVCKRRKLSSGRHHRDSASSVSRRGGKQSAKNPCFPERCGMYTPTKHGRKCGSLFESPALEQMEKELLFHPPKPQFSVPLSPLKVWNSDVKEALHQSPKQCSRNFLPGKQQLPVFKIQ